MCVYIAQPVRQHAALKNFLVNPLCLSHSTQARIDQEATVHVKRPHQPKPKITGLFIIAHALAFPLSLFAPWTMRFRCGLDKLWQLQKHT